MKKLKIKFVKFERAIAAQILEQEGLPARKGEGTVRIINYLEAYENLIFLRGVHKEYDWKVDSLNFQSNAERDEWMSKITQAITDEIFGGSGKLEIGKECLISDDRKNWHEYIFAGKCARQLGSEKRVLMQDFKGSDRFFRCKYAKPLGGGNPKIEQNGDVLIYTWEE